MGFYSEMHFEEMREELLKNYTVKFLNTMKVNEIENELMIIEMELGKWWNDAEENKFARDNVGKF